MTWQQVFYDWGGWNAALFHWVNAATPDDVEPLVWIFALLGNYWTAPAVMLGLWVWSTRLGDTSGAEVVSGRLARFGLAFAIALVAAATLKLLLNFPRPPAVLDHAIRVMGAVEYYHSLPSGHATYAALLVGTLWQLVGRPLRIVLVIYLIGVGWSRVAAGMHFPADILAGWGLGFACHAMAKWLHASWKSLERRATEFAVWRWYGLAAIFILIDQGTKTTVENTFAYAEQVSLTPFFNLIYVLNPGAAFSFLAGASGWQRYFFLILALTVSVWLVAMLRQRQSNMEAAGYSLVLGGALGNAVDRLARGKVVDFLDFHWQDVHWPAFNFADVGISLGVAFLLFASVAKKQDSGVDGQPIRSD